MTFTAIIHSIGHSLRAYEATFAILDESKLEHSLLH